MIVPKLCHRCHDGNIRCLEPVAPSAHHHDYGRCEYEEALNKEEPEEPLGIVTEVTAIIFLVAFLNLPAFLDKHGIDLTDILLHLANHPFVALKILLKMLLKVILKMAPKVALKMAPKKRFLINGSKTESERILKLQRRNWLK